MIGSDAGGNPASPEFLTLRSGAIFAKPPRSAGMPESALYTLRDIAAQLQLPESTTRYYRDAFAVHIPTVGTGRRRRYPEEAVAILRSVAEAYAAGKSHAQIDAELFGGTTIVAEQSRRAVLRRPLDTDEVLATILDGERERREAMWQIAREVIRLGEAIERQHAVLVDLVGRVGGEGGQALPAGSESGESVGPESGELEDDAAPPAPDATTGVGELTAESEEAAEVTVRDAALERELDALREELSKERELVERLRRSRLELERRAADAEERLGEGGFADGARRGILGRLLSRDRPEDG